VDVFGCPFKFGKWGNRFAAGSGIGVINLKEHGLVTLYDEGSVGHILLSGKCARCGRLILANRQLYRALADGVAAGCA
jgi:hypothetical protein